MDDQELLLTGLASGLDLPMAAAMSADDGDDGSDDDDRGGDDDNKQTGCGCLTSFVVIGALSWTLAGLLNV